MINTEINVSLNHTTTEAMIRVASLCKTYPDGSVNALKDISFSISSGKFIAITGPSGSGKSTLLNLLGALDKPTSGDIFIDGEGLSRCAKLDEFRSQKIGFVFQSFFLLPTLSAIENVQVPMFEGKIRSIRERVNRATELLEAVSMGHRKNHRPHQLSVGERQRVALARALANEPRLLLADEPTGNLDSRTAEEILSLLQRIQRERTLTMIIITHSPEVAERADRIIALRDGQIESDRINPLKPIS